MNLEVSWDGLWTLCFGLSQFQGHSSWLVCVMVLSHKKSLVPLDCTPNGVLSDKALSSKVVTQNPNDFESVIRSNEPFNNFLAVMHGCHFYTYV